MSGVKEKVALGDKGVPRGMVRPLKALSYDIASSFKRKESKHRGFLVTETSAAVVQRAQAPLRDGRRP